MASQMFPAEAGAIIEATQTNLLANSQANYGGLATGSGASYTVPFNGSGPNYNGLSAGDPLVAGFVVTFVANATNTTTTPTLTLTPADSSTFSAVITNPGGSALSIGEIAAQQTVTVVYNTVPTTPRFEIIGGGGSGSVGPTGPTGATGRGDGFYWIDRCIRAYRLYG